MLTFFSLLISLTTYYSEVSISYIQIIIHNSLDTASNNWRSRVSLVETRLWILQNMKWPGLKPLARSEALGQVWSLRPGLKPLAKFEALGEVWSPWPGCLGWWPTFQRRLTFNRWHFQRDFNSCPKSAIITVNQLIHEFSTRWDE